MGMMALLGPTTTVLGSSTSIVELFESRTRNGWNGSSCSLLSRSRALMHAIVSHQPGGTPTHFAASAIPLPRQDRDLHRRLIPDADDDRLIRLQIRQRAVPVRDGSDHAAAVGRGVFVGYLGDGDARRGLADR